MNLTSKRKQDSISADNITCESRCLINYWRLDNTDIIIMHKFSNTVVNYTQSKIKKSAIFSNIVLRYNYIAQHYVWRVLEKNKRHDHCRQPLKN